MKRPLLWITVAYVLGEVLARISLAAQIGSALLPAWKAGLLFYMAVWAGLWFGNWIRQKQKRKLQILRGQKRQILSLLPFFFLLGGILTLRYPLRLETDQAFERAEEKSLPGTAVGTVRKIEQRETGTQLLLSSCHLSVSALGEGYETDCEKLMIYLQEEPPSGLQEGNRILVTGSAGRLQEKRNPGAFDEKAYDRANGIAGPFYAETTQILSDRKDPVRILAGMLRRELEKGLKVMLGEQEAGFLQAALLGEKWAAPEEWKTLYEKAGIGHLLTVSGLHLSLTGAAVYEFMRKRLHLSYFVSALGCMSTAGVYYLMSGAGTSAQRAFGMLGIFCLGQCFGLEYDLASAAALTALLQLMFHPYLLFQNGWQLSYGAVLALGLFLPESTGKEKQNPFTVPVLIQIVTIPIQASSFYGISLYGIFWNVLLIPLFSLVAAGGFLTAVLGAAGGIFLFPARLLLKPVLTGLLHGYAWIGTLNQGLPGTFLRTGQPDHSRVLLYYLTAGALYVLILRQHAEQQQRTDLRQRTEQQQRAEQQQRTNLQQRAEQRQTHKGPSGRGSLRTGRCFGIRQLLAAACLLQMAFCLMPQKSHALEVVFLDVGQGDGIFLSMPDGTTMMIDGGSSDEKNLSDRILTPFLDSRAVEKLDYLLISHGDGDHINGALDLICAGRVRTLILPQGEEQEALHRLMTAAGQTGTRCLWFGVGDSLQAGNAKLYTLWPKNNSPDGVSSDGEALNDRSMVLWLTYEKFDVLFTGDLGENCEERLLEVIRGEECINNRKLDVLKAGHHGSGHATTEKWLEQLAPDYAVLSCGFANRYGHPAAETLKRLEEAGTKYYRTDFCGAVQMRTDGEKLEIRTMKEQKKSDIKNGT